MDETTLALTWGQASMVEMFHRRGLEPAEWPLSAMFDDPPDGTTREQLVAAHQALADRHDVLRATFERVSADIDLADPRTYPAQRLRGTSTVDPFTIRLDSVDAPLDSESLLTLVHSEFVRRGVAYLPVLVDRAGRWSTGAVVSHLAVDGQGLNVLRHEFDLLVRGDVPARPAVSVEQIVSLERQDARRRLEERNLAVMGERLRASVDGNLCQDATTERAAFGVVESAVHARTVADLSATLRVSKAGLSLLVYAVLVAADLDQRQVVIRSMVRRPSEVPGTVSVVASSPFACVQVTADHDLSVRDLVRREYGNVLDGYRRSTFSPFGYERTKRQVASDRGLTELDGLPEFNYLGSSRDTAQRARRVAASSVERSWVEFVDGVRPYSRGNLSIFEEEDHDVLQLFGNSWRQASDSFEMVRLFDRFCVAAAEDVDLRVADVLERARDAFRRAPVSYVPGAADR